VIVENPKVKAGKAKSSGVIAPQSLKWHHRLAASLIYCLIRTVACTLRRHWEIHPGMDQLPTPAIYTIWHNRLLLGLILYRDYKAKMTRPSLAAIVSASKDGGVVARILEHFGVQPVRGSSSRRGPQALLELTTWAERGYDLAITPDGPRGPCYVAQSGVIALAQVTGLSIAPASYELGWKFTLKSWDRFQIPLPFSKCLFKFGDPVSVPRDASEAEREALRELLEERMNKMTVD
jgi:lysophospholipid acyltransferase (LPLAT)-like uncharacterized protein